MNGEATLQVQVLYEISMGMAVEPTVERTAKRALSLYLHKLGCTTGIILRSNVKGKDMQMDTIAVTPRNLELDPIYRDERDSIRAIVAAKGLEAFLDTLPRSGRGTHGTFYIMKLPGFGVIILVKAGTPFTPMELHGINRLNNKLGEVCRAALHAESLEAQVQERTRDLTEANEKLKESLANIKTLTGLLPICAGCKKIRDDNGYWNQIESYMKAHSNVEFTHGLCPSCIKKYYPEYADDEEEKKKDK